MLYYTTTPKEDAGNSVCVTVSGPNDKNWLFAPPSWRNEEPNMYVLVSGELSVGKVTDSYLSSIFFSPSYIEVFFNVR